MVILYKMEIKTPPPTPWDNASGSGTAMNVCTIPQFKLAMTRKKFPSTVKAFLETIRNPAYIQPVQRYYKPLSSREKQILI